MKSNSRKLLISIIQKLCAPRLQISTPPHCINLTPRVNFQLLIRSTYFVELNSINILYLLKNFATMSVAAFKTLPIKTLKRYI